MRLSYKLFSVIALVFSTLAFSTINRKTGQTSKGVFPWKQSGLTEREAAAHLLSRFTFGAEPGQVDDVVKIGLVKWFQQQLDANAPEDALNEKLKNYGELELSNQQIINTYVKPAEVLKMAIRDGYVNKDSVNKEDKAAYKAVLQEYMQKKGIKPQQELFRQLANQKILRAAYGNNQLQEVLTDFWFNHFNVSITKNDCAAFIPAYERDVIRPNALGHFDKLLLATAKSPAMLLYLDNFLSAAADTAITIGGGNNRQKRIEERQGLQSEDSLVANKVGKGKNRKNNQGLNENYAREVMELHTLGVDGGYTQSDVTQAARIFTGWTIYPMADYGPGNAIRKLIDRVGENNLAARGFVHDGDFLFAANRHDKGPKLVLGRTFAAGGEYDEGLTLINMLAHHHSTAQFISRKIAVRFVSDNPPSSLVDRMAKTFLDKDGDIKQVLLTMVSSPEFWSKEALRQKTKSPFEFAISAVRALKGDINMPYKLYNWIDKMGQKMYYYQAPTGFPDKGQYWINSGALLTRMNFGLALAAGKIPGIKVDLLQLNQGHEPESSEAALLTFGKIIMPERDLNPSVKRLTPLLNDPTLQQKVATKEDKQPIVDADLYAKDENVQMSARGKEKAVSSNNQMIQTSNVTASMLSQVVGIIIGSPEFQRR